MAQDDDARGREGAKGHSDREAADPDRVAEHATKDLQRGAFKSELVASSLVVLFAFQLLRHSCSLRELSQVRGTSFSGGEGITLLPAISCKFCNPNGSCIEQSGIEPSPSGAFQHTASRQPAHRPVTQDAGSAPHDDEAHALRGPLTYPPCVWNQPWR